MTGEDTGGGVTGAEDPADTAGAVGAASAAAAASTASDGTMPSQQVSPETPPVPAGAADAGTIPVSTDATRQQTPDTARQAKLKRRVRFIVAFTISYNLIEAVVSVLAGSLASSTALIGFGLDSTIEIASAAAIAWQFTRKDPERWERATLKAIAIAFFALAAYVTVDSVLSLTGGGKAEHSPLGIAITALSVVIMPLLAAIEIRTGKELGSKSVQADAKQLLLCVYLSGAVLLGLLANSLFGWWWADSVAALVVGGLALREGIEAWKGEAESPLLVLDSPEDDD